MPKSKKIKNIIMNFKEFAESRKSVRGFLDKPVPKKFRERLTHNHHLIFSFNNKKTILYIANYNIFTFMEWVNTPCSTKP